MKRVFTPPVVMMARDETVRWLQAGHCAQLVILEPRRRVGCTVCKPLYRSLVVILPFALSVTILATSLLYTSVAQRRGDSLPDSYPTDTWLFRLLTGPSRFVFTLPRRLFIPPSLPPSLPPSSHLQQHEHVRSDPQVHQRLRLRLAAWVPVQQPPPRLRVLLLQPVTHDLQRQARQPTKNSEGSNNGECIKCLESQSPVSYDDVHTMSTTHLLRLCSGHLALSVRTTLQAQAALPTRHLLQPGHVHSASLFQVPSS